MAPPVLRREPESIPLSLTRDDLTPALDDPSFWTRRAPEPDHRLLAALRLAKVNAQILRREPQRVDVLGLADRLPAEMIRQWIAAEPFPPEGPRYHVSRRRVTRSDYARLRAGMNFGALKGARSVRFGLVTAEADVRGAPTAAPLLWAPDRPAFDALQWSLIGPGEPVALLHTSAGGRWGFVQTPCYRGWIALDRIGLADREVVQAFARPRDFVVVIGPTVRISGQAVHPGMALPLLENGRGWLRLQFPRRGPGGALRLVTTRVKPTPDLHRGYLPLTRRRLLSQAFRFLGLPYRWGGLDCSQFVQWVFRPFGLHLPRNSAQQAKVGRRIATLSRASAAEERAGALRRARPGTTLLQLPGHIMLFLGQLDGRAYAIHAIHRYHDVDAAGRDQSVYLDRVLVTDLDRGARHPDGSLLERITVITDVIG